MLCLGQKNYFIDSYCCLTIIDRSGKHMPSRTVSVSRPPLHRPQLCLWWGQGLCGWGGRAGMQWVPFWITVLPWHTVHSRRSHLVLPCNTLGVFTQVLFDMYLISFCFHLYLNCISKRNKISCWLNSVYQVSWPCRLAYFIFSPASHFEIFWIQSFIAPFFLTKS